MGAVGHIVRKYGAVVFFPTFTATTIYADWTHTRNWKRELRQRAFQQQQQNQ